MDHIPLLHVPEAKRAVVRGGSEDLPVRGESDGLHNVQVPFQFMGNPAAGVSEFGKNGVSSFFNRFTGTATATRHQFQSESEGKRKKELTPFFPSSLHRSRVLSRGIKMPSFRKTFHHARQERPSSDRHVRQTRFPLGMMRGNRPRRRPTFRRGERQTAGSWLILFRRFSSPKVICRKQVSAGKERPTVKLERQLARGQDCQ